MENLLIPLMGAGFGPRVFFGLLAALAVAFVVAKLVRSGRVGPIRYDRAAASAGRPARSPEDDALATLKARLASGDLTPEEYLARSSVLRRPSTDL